ncbi:hypothetical protein GCM10025858_32300 [Alicyclobacillus sacchari]|nr:hypothetical protein GCM10025858_32300 [Alicyclobacillus sacchari]
MYEAVIVDAVRTPIGRRNGALKDVHPVDLLGHVLRAIVERNPLPPEAVDDVIAGCLTQIGDQAVNIARNAWLAAGLPESVPGCTIDRQCGSSLQALHFAAQGVMSGAYEIAIACGVEAMSSVPMMSSIGVYGTPMTESLEARYHMRQYNRSFFDQALGAELLAKEWGFSREDLDRFGLRSHQLAAKARSEGSFGARSRLPLSLAKSSGRFEEDEGIRTDTSLEKMLSLKPAFPDLELITATRARSRMEPAQHSSCVEKRRRSSGSDREPGLSRSAWWA